MTIQLPSKSIRRSLELATQSYQDQLESDPLAKTYLKNRGISKEVRTYFRLGVVKQAHPESGHDFQIDRLAIPYITNTGIVQIRFRSIPFDGIPGNPEPSPKMKSEAGAGTTMFNVRALNHTTGGILAICEGEFDTMTAHQAGLDAIGIPGAQAWQSLFALGLKFRKTIILADNDDHGEGLKFAEKVQADLRGTRIILMPEGYDVNSFVVENGIGALRQEVGLE